MGRCQRRQGSGGPSVSDLNPQPGLLGGVVIPLESQRCFTPATHSLFSSSSSSLQGELLTQSSRISDDLSSWLWFIRSIGPNLVNVPSTASPVPSVSAEEDASPRASRRREYVRGGAKSPF